MSNFEKIKDINENVSMEEFGRFIIINDRKSRLTNMVAIRKFANIGFDYKKHLLELKNLDDEYRAYARIGNCDAQELYKKRLAVVKKLEELEQVLRSI
ncbi:MAG: hypothetical protein ACRC57_00945 [Sarcina sp.]